MRLKKLVQGTKITRKYYFLFHMAVTQAFIITTSAQKNLKLKEKIICSPWRTCKPAPLKKMQKIKRFFAKTLDCLVASRLGP